MKTLKEIMRKESSKDMAKILLGGTATILAAKLLTLTCLVFSICLLVSLVIVTYRGLTLINRTRSN